MGYNSAYSRSLRLGVVVVFLLRFGLASVEASEIGSSLYVKPFGPAGTRFELDDHLKNPAFAWPRTLLSWPVDFSANAVRSEDLVLEDAVSGQAQPFQLSDVDQKDGKLVRACVSFFSDLPSGGHRAFELRAGSGNPGKSVPGVIEQTAADVLELDNGVFQVRLPRSATFAPTEDVPGPIMALNRGTGWIGKSSIISSKHRVKSLQVDKIDDGPLFTTYRLTYDFDDGGTYVATVRIIAGYPYVELSEEVTGLAQDDGAFVENAWTDFHPTHRQIVGGPFGALLRIDEPIVQAFRGEDPAFTGPPEIENLAVEMLPSLTPYWPNGWGGNREAAFWDEKSGSALGLFITDVAKWQDHDYAIWTSAETLKVKYRYADGVLYWKWPLVTGTRQTGIMPYQHGTNESADGTNAPTEASPEEDSEGKGNQMELPLKLRIWYGDLNLDRVKDWVLSYPETGKRPDFPLGLGRKKSVEDYMASLPTCAMTGMVKGMFHPVALRDMGYWVVPDFNRFRADMTPEQRSQASAYLLFTAYVAAEEGYSPMETMLGGHPNFMADLKFPLAAAASLFPEHPMAKEWNEQYEKFMELCGHFYVRPGVSEWEAKPGRFTESIATYNWAFLAPTTKANFLNLTGGGRNFYATPELADMGDYLAGILTAPVTADPDKTALPEGVPLTWENGFKRIHPPQGAHSGRRGAPGPMYTLGQQLQNYRPLTAEHLMWGSWPSAAEGFEDRPGLDSSGSVNHGTNPHLTSAKYNGYGFVLRAGVDTPDEISVFLQQIDKGPNYRWGYANQNGSGDIYYYAQGKSYSGHEREEAGDGHVDDAMFSCNTGVYKNWHFSSIGMNELTQPLYALGFAQFAEIVPEKGAASYSWPEYQSRSVMLVGTDYIIVYDRILAGCGTRFAWNVSAQDEMPFIYHLRGGGDVVNLVDPKTGRVRGSLSTMIKGGDSHMALVTHKKDVQVLPNKNPKGAPPLPYVHVRTPKSDDYVFQADKDITYTDSKMTFNGSVGVIRHDMDGQTELALFHGSQIAVAGVSLAVDNPDLGLSAVYRTPDELAGDYFVRKASMLTLKSPGQGTFYVDAVALAPETSGAYELPAGQHHWQYTSHLPEPMPPVILRTENHDKGARVFFIKVNGATKYRIELSTDSGLTWKSVGESIDGTFDITGEPNGTKVHVRVVAMNADHESRPSDEYPVYVTNQAPAPPDGIKLQFVDGNVRVRWGEVLGPIEYRLYRRALPDKDFKEVFRGLQTEFVDREVSVAPANREPGLASNVWPSDRPVTVYEYAVSAVTGNGEGARSVLATSDPTSWLNWNPDVPLRFKRQSQFWLPPWVPADQTPPLYYPDSL